MSSASSTMRSPRSALSITPFQKASALCCASGHIKLPDAPPSTQSMSISASVGGKP
jgi:hypothetical protein